MSSQDVTIAIVVGDSALRAEVLAAAAATSVHVTTVEDPRDFPRHLPKASVVIADKLTAALVAKYSVAPVFFVVADPGPIDYEAAMKCRSAEAFIVPAESKQLLSALADQVSPREQSGGSFALAVVGAAGGVGTSTFAYALAVEAGAGLLVDAAPYSGGLDLLAGIEEEPGARWPDLASGSGAVNATDLHRAVPRHGNLGVLAASRSAHAQVATLKPARREAIFQAAALHPQGAVFDAAPGDIPQVCEHVIIVCAAEVRSAAACAQLVGELRAQQMACSVVVRHRQWSGLESEDIANIVHCDPIAEIPTVRGLTKAVETDGLRSIPRPLRAAAQRVIDEVLT
ncbi:septum site-determining protein Ssd [Corynebacterium striatum]